MKIRIFSAICAVIIIFSSFPLIVSAADDTFTADGMTFTSDGFTATLTAYSGSAKRVVVPETVDGYTVTVIGPEVFQKNADIEELVFPETVRTVSKNACNNMKNLSSVKLNSPYLKLIDTNAFKNCRNLVSFELSDEVNGLIVGDSAFAGCTSLTLCVDESIVSIGDSAFSSMGGLDEIRLGAELTHIGSCAFANTPAKHISVDPANEIYFDVDGVLMERENDGVTLRCYPRDRKADNGAYTVPDCVDTVGSYAFYLNTTISHLLINSNVGKMCEYACGSMKSLAEITLTPDTSDIAGSCFEGCENIKTVYFSGMEAEYKKCNIHFKNCDPKIVYVSSDDLYYNNQFIFRINPDGETVTLTGYISDEKNVVIPSSVQGYAVTGIEKKTFSGVRIDSVTIPGSIKSVPAGTFKEHYSLKTVVLERGIETVEAECFYGCTSLMNITLPDTLKEIGEKAFADIHAEKIVLPSSLEKIDAMAFGWTYITELTVPDSVTYIDPTALNGCFKLSHLNLGSGVKDLTAKVFDGCTSLESVTVSDDNPYFTMLDEMLVSKDKSEIVFCSRLRVGTVTIPKSVIKIGDYAFSECALLKSVEIPDTVEIIGDFAFNGCRRISGIELPRNVTSLGEYAFSGCTVLKTVILPEKLEAIPAGLFSGCTEILKIIIPEKVTSIGDFAFMNCTALSGLTLPEGLKTIGEGSFKSCTSFVTFALPDGVTVIPDSAFASCIKLESIILSDKTDSIGAYAFANCVRLADFDLPNTVRVIGAGAFSGCTSFTQFRFPDNTVTVSESVLSGCTSLKKVFLPKKLYVVDKNAFSGCTAVTDVFYHGDVIDLLFLLLESFDPEGNESIFEDDVSWYFVAFTVIYGDINSDGKVNASDALMMRKAIAGKLKTDDKQRMACDINKDGKINVGDSKMQRSIITGRIQPTEEVIYFKIVVEEENVY